MVAVAHSVPVLPSIALAAPKPAPKLELTPQPVRPEMLPYPGGPGGGGATGGGVGGGDGGDGGGGGGGQLYPYATTSVKPTLPPLPIPLPETVMTDTFTLVGTPDGTVIE